MTQQGIEVAEAEPGCAHHWAIESPNGPTSYGICKRCGETREFRNSIKITSWESEGSHVNRNPR
ncbi:MAG: hypothetical protein OXL97_07480 [Chloroflexota bacterium]|nr:hypothetical protein [Chloroflexota bacterium]MDE2885850.1 hypothetical protein [Chloroflexota bacterium]